MVKLEAETVDGSEDVDNCDHKKAALHNLPVVRTLQVSRLSKRPMHGRIGEYYGQRAS